MTHFCSDRVTHGGPRPCVRKPKVGKAISSRRRRVAGVRFREQSRVISRECRSFLLTFYPEPVTTAFAPGRRAWQGYSVAAGIAGGVAAAFWGRLAAFRAAFTGAFSAAAFFAAGARWALAAVAASALTLAQRLRLTSAMAFFASGAELPLLRK